MNLGLFSHFSLISGGGPGSCSPEGHSDPIGSRLSTPKADCSSSSTAGLGRLGDCGLLPVAGSAESPELRREHAADAEGGLRVLDWPAPLYCTSSLRSWPCCSHVPA